MLFLAENKRKVLAGILAVVVLLAIGFAIGRLTHRSGEEARAATARRAQSREIKSLHRQVQAARSEASTAESELSQAHSEAAEAATQLSEAQSYQEALQAAASHRKAQLAAVDQCLKGKHARRCVRQALR